MYIRPALQKHLVALEGNISSLLNLKRTKDKAPELSSNIINKGGRRVGKKSYISIRQIDDKGNKVIKISTYPAEWAKFLIKYYSIPGDNLLDPFGNRGNIGFFANKLGRHVILNDVVPLYVEGMRCLPRVRTDLRWECLGLDWGAKSLDFSESVQAIITSPPYWNLEKYESVEKQASDFKAYDEFLSWYKRAIHNCYDVLEPGCFCIFTVSNFRREKKVVPLVEDTVRLFIEVGFNYHERGIFYMSAFNAFLHNTMAVRNRRLVKMHEEFVVGLKP